jgi:hypothetical protein
MEGFIKPKQQMITKDLVRLMNAEGIGVWNAEIVPLQLFDDDTESENIRLRTMTINELREDMELPAFEDERGDIIPAQTTPLPAPTNTTPA